MNMAPDNTPPPPPAAKKYTLPEKWDPSIYWEGMKVLARDAWAKMQNVAGTNVELGKFHLAQGNYTDAILRFRIAMWLRPEDPEIWYCLGLAYVRFKDPKKAQWALGKALQFKPGYKDAAQLLHEVKHPELTAPPPSPPPVA